MMEEKEMTRYTKEVVQWLNLPSIPKKKWDGISAFKHGVAETILEDGDKAYAIASYDDTRDHEPRITKVFTLERYVGVGEIFVVPDYMDDNVKDFDLSPEDKRKAQALLDEAKSLENEGLEETNDTPIVEDNNNEWVFEEIHNREEAEAWVKNYKRRNKIKGGVPKSEESLKNYLYVVASNIKRGIV